MTGILIRKARFGHRDTHTGSTLCEGRSYASTSRGTTGMQERGFLGHREDCSNHSFCCYVVRAALENAHTHQISILWSFFFITLVTGTGLWNHWFGQSMPCTPVLSNPIPGLSTPDAHCGPAESPVTEVQSSSSVQTPRAGPQWCPILWQWIYPPAKMLTHCLARDLSAGVLLITSPSSLGYSKCALSRLQSIKVGLWALVLSHLYPWPSDLSLK